MSEPSQPRSRYAWEAAIWRTTATLGTKATAHALKESCSARGMTCYPSANTIAEMTGIGEATVTRGVSWLRRHGWIATHRKTGPSGHTHNVYTLRFPEDGEVQQASPKRRRRGSDEVVHSHEGTLPSNTRYGDVESWDAVIERQPPLPPF